MASDKSNLDDVQDMAQDIVYKKEKDYYKGASGELRMKAEGLFKKAKEKGISVEDIDIVKLYERSAQFPGIGEISLPAFVVKVKGKDLSTGQVIADGKQIDYFNRFQKYLAQKIESKNIVRDESGKTVYRNKRPKISDKPDFSLTDWELFEIGKELLDDKEFGLEKTITGACDRIIRKLMGENDWLYPEEARMLDEEFSVIESKIQKEKEKKESVAVRKMATVRQINYLKQKLKNMDIDPDNSEVMQTILREMGFEAKDINELTVGEMSKIIENLNSIAQKIKENLPDSVLAANKNTDSTKEIQSSYRQ
ncbi:hypothetical protein [Acetivibrio clariflavus]|uniref:Uncharacterized protein n=1 Tax=Acetivibrio clariflavus (strain DSM 19732 / NBRC 101661 / EBR45) TaxID=720554 RepID=G8LY54_ACECE|nr:hypothetical protein [Acetivibrio clariflavus]AEV67785.1 hypothetical protein Clocl_1110 [Acetivibrio clariflavus DSM 19732]